MYSIKAQMLSDMFVLLRLHDRYPSRPTTAAAAPAPAEVQVAAGATDRTQTGTSVVAGGGPSGHATGAAAAAPRVRRVQADAGINPVLLQAATQAYFSSRPHVTEMVAAAAAQMVAAVAVTPTRFEVATAVQPVLDALKQQQGQHTGSGADACDQLSNMPLQYQGQQQQQQGQQVQPEQQQQQQQQDAMALLLQEHRQQLVQVECELSSAGGWQSLLLHMPTQQQALDQGWQLHFDTADTSVVAWLRLRPGAA
jgi:flagellar motor protein MotB